MIFFLIILHFYNFLGIFIWQWSCSIASVEIYNGLEQCEPAN